MPLPNIEFWPDIQYLYGCVAFVAEKYESQEIVIRNEVPLGYVSQLQGLAYFYGDDLLSIAAVMFRTIVKGHPLQDGNKRLGCFLAENFLLCNNTKLIASDEALFEVAMGLATSQFDWPEIRAWLEENTEFIDLPP